MGHPNDEAGMLRRLFLQFPWLAPGLAPALAPVAAQAQPSATATLPRAITVPPEPDSYRDAQLGITVTQGDFPAAGMFGWNIQPTSETFSVRRRIAAGSRTRTTPVALAGYADSASPLNGAVGVFGQGSTSVDATGVFGANFLATNCAADDLFARHGHNTIVYGVEVDVNVAPLADGQPPAGAAFGIHISGASAIRPLGDAAALHIDPMNGYSRAVRWKDGIRTEDGAADRGITLGALANSQNILDGTGRVVAETRPSASANQGLFLRTFDPAGVLHEAYVTADADGNLILGAGRADGIVEVGTGPYRVKAGPSTVEITGAIAASAPAASAPAPCIVAPGSNGTRGSVTLPPGVAECRVDLGRAFPSAPFVVVSGDVPGVAVAVLRTGPGTAGANGWMTLGVPRGGRGPVMVTWIMLL